MFQITKIFNIPYGHRLSQHKGFCKNIHGHNAKIEIVVQREIKNENGMVIDFSTLKKLFNETIGELFDHCLLLNVYNKEDKELAKILKKRSFKILEFLSEPTAEFMSEFIYNVLSGHLLNIDPELSIHSVSVWETDSAKATYIPPES